MDTDNTHIQAEGRNVQISIFPKYQQDFFSHLNQCDPNIMNTDISEIQSVKWHEIVVFKVTILHCKAKRAGDNLGEWDEFYSLWWYYDN